MSEKVERFNFRMTASELENLKINAKQRGISVSAYIRDTAVYKNSITSKEEFVIKKEYLNEIRRLIYEINRIGNNINQIVKSYNSEFYDYSDKEKLNAFLNEIIKIEKDILDMEERLWQ